MNSEKRTTRGRGRGRARGRARGRGRGRGKKVPKVMSSDEECSVEEASQEPAEPVTEEPKEVREEPVEPAKLEVPSDISQLEAPVFTTLTRGPPEPMLRLDWSHRATLIGEKVLNPMIYCCDTCIKPILIYGRMIPCKHVFCLSCARSDHTHCPRCREKVLRVEQTGLGTVFMCTHSGTRYGNTGCRRTYLSQRDLQAHINHRHVSSGADSKQEDAPSVASLSVKPITLPPSANDPRAHAQHGGAAERPRARTNLITVPIQETDSHYYNYSYPPPPQPVPPPAACSVSVLHSMNVPPPYYASAYSAPPNTYLQPGTNMTPNVSGVAPLPAPTLSAPLGAPLEGARWPYPAGGTPWAQHYYR